MYVHPLIRCLDSTVQNALCCNIYVGNSERPYIIVRNSTGCSDSQFIPCQGCSVDAGVAAVYG